MMGKVTPEMIDNLDRDLHTSAWDKELYTVVTDEIFKMKKRYSTSLKTSNSLDSILRRMEKINPKLYNAIYKDYMDIKQKYNL